MDLPSSVVVDATVLDARLSGTVAGQLIEMRWPAVNSDGELVSPACPLRLPGDLVWGEPSQRGGHIVDRVLLITPDVADPGNSFSRLAGFRSSLMLWIGVLTGQPSTTRWGETTSQRDREGIRYATTGANGQAELHHSPTRTISFHHEGAGIGVLQLDRAILADAWKRATSGEEPPLMVEMFQQAREAFQRRQHKVAVLEAAAALEMLWWARFQEHPDVPNTPKYLTLGKLAKRLKGLGLLDHHEGSPSWEFVDLRNRLTHHPERDYFHHECIDGFEFVLQQFTDRHPKIYRTPSGDGPHLI